MHNALSLKNRSILDQPDSKRAYNAALFAVVAPRYDLVTRLLSFGRDAAWKRSLIRALPPHAAPRCVDLACGTGDVTRLLRARHPDAEICGIDLTPSMLDIARRRDPEHAADYRTGDMCDTHLAGASVDMVTGAYALRNAPELRSALDEVYRILKPGGTASFLDFSKPAARRLAGLQTRLLRFWGRFWGVLLHRNGDVYGYIADSLERFPDRQALRAEIARAGFVLEGHRTHFCGMLERIQFRKPSV